MVSDRASSKGYGAKVAAVKKAAACSLSNGKRHANTLKKIHKAEREKLKRDHMNELFQELSRDLDPLGQSNCKASILADTTRSLRDLLLHLEKLREEHSALISEFRYITLERDELEGENLALKSDIGMLQNELSQRSQHCGDDTRLTLAHLTSIPDSHGDAKPASLVQRPQARYPSPSDSWPAKLLSSLPRASSHEQEPSTRLIQMDDKAKLA